MSYAKEQIQETHEEILPIRLRINWWAVFGLLVMLSSSVLSIAIIYEIVGFLRALV